MKRIFMRKIFGLLLFTLAFNAYSNVRLLDKTFGTKGISSLISPYKDISVSDTLELSDGKVIFIGSYSAGSHFSITENGYLIGRLNGDGTTDYSFGTEGFLRLAQFVEADGRAFGFKAVKLLASKDGGFYIVGSHKRALSDGLLGNAVLVSKHLGNGQLNKSFGDNGVVHLSSLDSPSFFYNFMAVIDEQERITVTGLSWLGGGEPSYFIISRVTSDGVIDQVFGNNGSVRIPTTATFNYQDGDSSPVTLSDFHLAANGKEIITISKATNRNHHFKNSNDSWKLFLQVFNNNGALQSSQFIDLHGLNSNFKVLLDDDNNISIGGVFELEHGVSEFGVLKVNSNGQVVNDFGVNGLAHFNVPDNPMFEYHQYSLHDFNQRRDGTYVLIGTKYLEHFLFAATLDVNGTLSNIPVEIEIGKLDARFSFSLMDEMSDGGSLIRVYGSNTNHFIKLSEDALKHESFLSQGRSYLTNFNEVRKMKILKDRSILLGGYGTVQENFNPNSDVALISKLDEHGRLDTTFGDNGYASIEYGDGTFVNSLSIFDIAVNKNDEIISSGILNSGSGVQNLFLAKFTSSGKVEPSFADSGIFEFNPTSVDEKYSQVFANSLRIMEDLSIIIVGYISGVDATNAFIMKLTSSGILDKSFGNEGYYVLNIPEKNSFLFDVVTSGKDSFVASGGVSGSLGQDILAINFNSLGKLNKDFGNNGVSIVGTSHSDELAYSIETDVNNSNYYLAGYGNVSSEDGHTRQRPLVINISNDGVPNKTFGEQGFKYLKWGKFDVHHANSALDISRDMFGNLLVVGYADLDVNQWTLKSNIGVAALKPDGTLISSFGDNGIINLNFHDSIAWNIQPTSSNSLLIAGAGYGVGLVTKLTGYTVGNETTNLDNKPDQDSRNESESSGGAINIIELWYILILLFTKKFVFANGRKLYMIT
jgi:uncharacterized delta-60 repeat protein